MPAKKAAKRTMPAFTKPTATTLSAFNGATEKLEGVERRTMFGYPAIFMRGNMIACVFQDRIMVRLSETDRSKALAMSGAKLFEPSPGRAMKEYVELPALTVASPAEFGNWLGRARSYGASMPVKKIAVKKASKKSVEKTAKKKP